MCGAAGRWRGLNMRGGAHTPYIPYNTASRQNLDLHCVKRSQQNILEIYNHDLYYDQNHCSNFVILFQYGFPELEDSRVLPFILHRHHCPAVLTIFAVRGCKGVSWVGRGTPLSSRGGTSILDYKLKLKIYCNTQNQAKRYGPPSQFKKVLHHQSRAAC